MRGIGLMEDRLIALQEMFAHQARDMQALSDEVYMQQKEIALLHKQLKQLQHKIASHEDGAAQPAVQEMPLPHY